MDKRHSAALVTLVAGCTGGALFFAAALISGAFRSEIWLFVVFGLFLVPVFGSMYAAPVTLVVLPVVRWLLPGQDLVSFSIILLAGLISGFFSPIAIMIATADFRWEYPALIGTGCIGACCGLIAAILWFRLTRTDQCN
jgi:hypothetical protein